MKLGTELGEQLRAERDGPGRQGDGRGAQRRLLLRTADGGETGRIHRRSVTTAAGTVHAIPCKTQPSPLAEMGEWRHVAERRREQPGQAGPVVRVERPNHLVRTR